MKRLTPEEVREVLTSPLSLRAMARKLGCSKQAIAFIRTGHTHAKLFPNLPRQQPRTRSSQRPLTGGRSCFDCQRWVGGDNPCLDGIPDPSIEGPSFAVDCDFFTQIP